MSFPINSSYPSGEQYKKARLRFFFLLGFSFLILIIGLVTALILRSNIDTASYDPLLGAWKSSDGKTTLEFTADKTMIEKIPGRSGSQEYRVRVMDPNTLELTAPDGSTRQVDWLISEEHVLVLVSGQNAVTYRR